MVCKRRKTHRTIFSRAAHFSAQVPLGPSGCARPAPGDAESQPDPEEAESPSVRDEGCSRSTTASAGETRRKKSRAMGGRLRPARRDRHAAKLFGFPIKNRRGPCALREPTWLSIFRFASSRRTLLRGPSARTPSRWLSRREPRESQPSARSRRQVMNPQRKPETQRHCAKAVRRLLMHGWKTASRVEVEG